MTAARISATAAALDALERLAVRHGELELFQSGGCCDGSLPLCLPAGELPHGPRDVLLGAVGGASFWIDGEQDARWGHPHFEVDVAAGAPEGFSLGPPDAHFVTRSGAAR